TTGVLGGMVARGSVRLDDPVAKYLPSSVRMPSRGGKQITLAHLATHTSGLPSLPGNFQPSDSTNPYADFTVEQMYQFLSGYTLPREIGAEYEYSNLGMGLLGHALARRAEKSYEDLLIEQILAPLDMADTRIGLTPAMRARAVSGHDQQGEPVPYWDIPTLAGAGALRSTANDMLAFLKANLDSSGGPLHRALAATHALRHQTETPGLAVGLGWHIAEFEGRPLVWHNGGTGGFRSFMAFDEARRRGVIVLANSSEDVDDIGFHLLEPRSPLTPAPTPRKEITLAPEALNPYLGVYQLSPAFWITVTREDGALFVQATGQGRFRLHPESETDFFLREVDARVSFERDSSGTVSRLVLHQGGQHTPGQKVE
ncbi:MAG: serine hydrolase, partial [Gemmatimonadales bacterium]|nr:serine hydrolase [Gemmatimonadales bacterium]